MSDFGPRKKNSSQYAFGRKTPGAFFQETGFPSLSKVYTLRHPARRVGRSRVSFLLMPLAPGQDPLGSKGRPPAARHFPVIGGCQHNFLSLDLTSNERKTS